MSSDNIESGPKQKIIFRSIKEVTQSYFAQTRNNNVDSTNSTFIPPVSDIANIGSDEIPPKETNDKGVKRPRFDGSENCKPTLSSTMSRGIEFRSISEVYKQQKVSSQIISRNIERVAAFTGLGSSVTDDRSDYEEEGMDSEVCCEAQDDSDEEDDEIGLSLASMNDVVALCTTKSTEAASVFEASSALTANATKRSRATCCNRNDNVKGSSAQKMKDFIYGRLV